MKRRAFIISTGGAAAGLLLLPRLARAEAGRIDWYTSSDQNVLDFWTNFVKPAFEAANPGVTLNLVDAGDAPGNIAIGERALAALAAKADPQADYFETYDPRLPSGAIDAGLFVNLKEAGLSNWSKINPLAHRHRLFGALPRQPGAARLRHRQAQARRRAEDLRRPRRLDQGEPRPVHLQPPRQGRLRRQLRPPRHLRGERQGPGQVHRRQLHPRGRRGGADAGLGSARRTSRRRSSTRAPTPRATPSRSSSSASPPSP